MLAREITLMTLMTLKCDPILLPRSPTGYPNSKTRRRAMNDFVRSNAAHESLAAACWECGITSAADFTARFGIAPAMLTASAALALVMTPAWVTDIWIPHAGRTPVAWVPAAVRTYAAVFGITQHEGESDHGVTMRLQAATQEVRVSDATHLHGLFTRGTRRD